MENVILLIEKDNNFKQPLIVIKQAFADWDRATLQCAKANSTASKGEYFYLKKVPFQGQIENNSYDVIRDGEEIKIVYYSDYSEEIHVDVSLSVSSYEEYHHEEVPPDINPTYEIDEISICGTLLKDLNLSEDLVKEIERVAENYRLEMEELEKD